MKTVNTCHNCFIVVSIWTFVCIAKARLGAWKLHLLMCTGDMCNDNKAEFYSILFYHIIFYAIVLKWLNVCNVMFLNETIYWDSCESKFFFVFSQAAAVFFSQWLTLSFKHLHSNRLLNQNVKIFLLVLTNPAIHFQNQNYHCFNTDQSSRSVVYFLIAVEKYRSMKICVSFHPKSDL